MRARTPLLMLVLLLSACNANDDKSAFTTSASAKEQSPAAGIWLGTDATSGQTVEGFIAESGEAHFFRADGVQYVGTATVSGSALSMTLQGFVQFGTQFPDGSTTGAGTFSGTLASGATLAGVFQFTTTGGTSGASTWSLSFDSSYDMAGSLGAVSGNYSELTGVLSTGLDPLLGTSLTIAPGGQVFAQGSPTGCVLNGMITNATPGRNLYQVSYTLQSCTGTYAPLNGVSFTGFATLNTSAAFSELLVVAAGSSPSGEGFGILLALHSA
jgi:hypothetical protein